MTVRAVFMGSDAFSAPVLRSLLECEMELREPLGVVGVLTQPDRPAGRGRRVGFNSVKSLALDHDVPVLQPERLRSPQAVAQVVELRPDLIVVASYGQIVPRSVLDLPTYRCLNLHPSLLPLYRGPSPIVAPLLSGDRITGVSLMLMVERMDAGPILVQEQTEIGSNETAGELEIRLANMSGTMLVSTLPEWFAGRIEPVPQTEDQATYTTKISKDDGRLDWSLPADLLTRRVRAFNPWPGTFTFWDGKLLRIYNSHVIPGNAEPGKVVSSPDGALCVGTGDGMLAVDQLQLAGGKRQVSAEFVRGHRHIIDAQLGSKQPWS